MSFAEARRRGCEKNLAGEQGAKRYTMMLQYA